MVTQVRDITDGTLDYAVEAMDGSNLVAEAVDAPGILGVCAMVGEASDASDAGRAIKPIPVMH